MNSGQQSALHDTLFCLADQKGIALFSEDDRSICFDLLLMLTFGQMRRNLFRPEYVRKLGPVLETVLKQRVIEVCPGAQVTMKRIVNYIEKDCLEFTIHDLTRTFA